MPTSRPPDRPAASPRRRALALASVLALTAAGTLAGTVLAKDGFRARVPDLPGTVADTVVLLGPRAFDAGRGEGAYHVERFGASTAAGRVHTVRLARGGASDAVLKVNGRTVYAGPLGAPVLQIPVTLAELNTLEVTVTGSSGTAVTLSVLETTDATFTVWGRRRFNRYTGTPVTETERFTLSATAAAPYALHVENGAPDGTHRTSSARVWVNGVEVLSPTHLNQGVPGLIIPVTLRAGENVIAAEVTSIPQAYITLGLSATDVTAPVLTIAAPPADLVTRETSVEVAGTVRDETATRVTVNQAEAARTGDAYRATVPLTAEGDNTITVSAVDAAGLRTDSVRTVIRDTEAPVIVLSAPTDGSVTRDSVVTVTGVVTDRTLAEVNVNGVAVTPAAGGAFEAQVPLAEGVNFVSVTASDRAGNATTSSRQVTRDTQAPVLTVTEPEDGATTEAEAIDVRGTVQDVSPVTVSVGTSAAVVGADGSFQASVPLAEGENTIAITATDAAGNTASASRRVTRGRVDLPPDPDSIAPPLDPTAVTGLGASTEFLYTGENPVQTGVAPGTIHPLQVSVIRGRVTSRDGRPLAGVAVTVLDHPEYGQTLSRADGEYDLAVNGGIQLLVNFTRTGYLPSQRAVLAEWQEFVRAGDVVMVPLDPQVTRVDLAADSLQVARGSVQTDADGSRQATLIFEPGTGAEMVLADGSVVPLSSLDVRATEYTVGENGPRAMPGMLPATSAYTYAVELSVDSAVTAGATTVRFTQPVEFYVENFLDFPVGIPVPVATYECIRCGAWVPEDDGKTIRILSVDGGLAAIDTDGDGAADDDATLAALGIDAAERARLATLYESGASLWRVRLKHFSPIDLNYPNGPPDDAEDPDQEPEEEEEEEKPCEKKGSIIECQNAVLGESLALPGTPFTLNYRSDRVPGRGAAGTIRIPLTDAEVPASLSRVELEIEVAGQLYKQSFDAAPNLEHTFVWNGRDAYGRRVVGDQPAIVKIGYVYPFTYRVPATTARSFGLSCTGEVDQPWSGSVDWQACVIPTSVTSRARQEDVLWQTVRLSLSAPDARAQGFGGWTLSEHHSYDPGGREIRLGTGERRGAAGMGPVITTVVGNGLFGSTGDGGQATAASIRNPDRVSVAADGTIYLPDAGSYKVRKVAPNGVITTFAGTGLYGFGGDGGPATQAHFREIYDVALGPDGALYIADFSNHRIRRVGTDGIITTVAGNGVNGWSGDGGPATQAAIGYPWGLAVGPDCSIYIASDWNVIRKVSPDGTITTIAGNGTWGYSGDGGLATLAQIDYPDGVALGPDGSLYIEDINNGAIRKVTPDGIISTVVGGWGTFGVMSAAAAPAEGGTGESRRAQAKKADAPQGDVPAEEEWNVQDAGTEEPSAGAMATAAAVGPYLNIPYSVTVGRDGTVYIAESGANRILALSVDGVLTPIVGSFTAGFSGDGGLGAAARLRGPWGVSVAPDGSLYISDTSNRRIRRVAPAFAGFSTTDVAVASESGDEVYQFTATGRHLRTLDARTGAVRWRFDYDARGFLSQATDGDGKVTRVERDAGGKPTALVGPFGDRVTLAADSSGWLRSVTSAGGSAVALEYDAGGLLTALVDPRGGRHAYTHSEDGLLETDTGPDGGTQRLVRTRDGTQVDAAFSTAEGRTTTHRIEALPGGGQRRVDVGTDGLETVSTRNADGTVLRQDPTGTVTTQRLGPDPRFGMQAPILEEMAMTTPGGVRFTLGNRRRAVLNDPRNALSLRTLTDSLVINGRVFTSTWDTGLRTLTRVTPMGRRTVTRTDSLGRPLEITRPGMTPLRYRWDSQGRIAEVGQSGRTWTYGYGADGRLQSMTDPLLRATTYEYDADGRLVRQVLPGGREVRTVYDAAGNVVGFAPPGRPLHTTSYSAGDRVLRYAPAGDSTQAVRYTYDADGQLTLLSRPDGDIAFGYDAAGRLSLVTRPGGELRYAYDPATGMNTSITGTDVVSLAFTWDGELATSATWSGEVSGSVQAAYEQGFRVRSLSVNGGMSTDFRYDNDGMLTGVGALTITRAAATGLPTATTVGGVSTGIAFDSAGDLTTLSAAAGAATLFRSELSRDALGRITRIQETTAEGTSVLEYGYDASDRLAQVKRDGVVVESYEYDANGNRLRAGGQAGAVDAAYDALDRLLHYGGETYGYTAGGALAYRAAGADTTTFTYDISGNLRAARLAGGTRVEYVVDAANRRVGKKVDGALVQGFLYSGQLSPVAELDGAGQVVSRFVYGTRLNVPDYMEKGGVRYRLVTDHLGSVRQVVNATTGQVVQRMDYDAYGRIIRDTNPGFQPFGFAGGLHDGHTGLTRFGARDYDARTGRWTARDPLGFSTGETNLYGYVLGDPVNATDPSGLWTNWDYIKHYFSGGGATVNLGSNGDLPKIIRHARSQMEAFKREAMRAAEAELQKAIASRSSSFSGSGNKTQNIDFQPVVFSVGNSNVRMSFRFTGTIDWTNCTYSFSGKTQFNINDRFEDPADIFDWFKGNVELPGAKPYAIVGQWGESFSGSGKFQR